MQHECGQVPSRHDTAKPAALAASTLKQIMMQRVVLHDYCAVDTLQCAPAKPAILLANF